MGSFRKTFFHIFVLAGLALSPLYGVLSKEPNFFLAHSSEPNDFFVMISMISFVFPLVIAGGATFILYLSGRRHDLGVRSFIALLVALVLLPFVTRVTGESISGAFLVVGFLGVVFSLLYGKLLAPRLFLNYISPAIIVFPALFFFEPKIFVLAVPEPPQEEYPVVSISSNTPVIFLLLDEFPLSALLNDELKIDEKAFPNFSRLAGKSNWFRNASADYAWTIHSISSILTGIKHNPNLLGTYRNYPRNLFTLFANDYDVTGYESTIRLCPPHICLNDKEVEGMGKVELFWKDISAVYLNLLLPQPKSFGVPAISENYKNFWGRNGEDIFGSKATENFVKKEFNIPLFEPGFDEKFYEGREDIFKKFLNETAFTSGKNFYFLHILFPHRPYRYLPSGAKYDLDGEFDMLGLNEKSPREGFWEDDDWLVKIQYQKLMSQVGYTDYLLGLLMKRLEDNKVLDSALFILAADHGVNIREGGYRRKVMADSIADIASVPLFIKLPGQEKGALSDLPATLLDIFPTLADILDIKVPWEMEGHSLLDVPFEKRERVIHDLDMQAFQVPGNLKDKLLAGVKRKHDFFGKFEGWDNFRLQDEKSRVFMDKPVSNFTILSMEDVRVELDLGSRVETGPGFFPAIVHGRITGIENRDDWTALVCVNDVFRAVSPIVKLKDQEKILAFLPEIAFKEGSNEIGIYLIRKSFVKGGEIFKPLLN